MPRGVYQRQASRWKDKDIPKHVHRTIRYDRKWNRKPIVPGTRPVPDPEATCVLCRQTGADWYGSAGDAVHMTCFRKSLGCVNAKQYNECDNDNGK